MGANLPKPGEQMPNIGVKPINTAGGIAAVPCRVLKIFGCFNPGEVCGIAPGRVAGLARNNVVEPLNKEQYLTHVASLAKFDREKANPDEVLIFMDADGNETDKIVSKKGGETALEKLMASLQPKKKTRAKAKA